MFKKLTVLLVAFLMFPVASQAENLWGYRTYVNKPFPGVSSLEHTYACVNSSFNCFSSAGAFYATGGNLTQSGWAQRVTGQCHAQCQMVYPWPSASFGNGSPHQHTNRVLFASGRFLNPSIVGYPSSKLIWGVTGNKTGPIATRFQACYRQCGGGGLVAID